MVFLKWVNTQLRSQGKSPLVSVFMLFWMRFFDWRGEGEGAGERGRGDGKGNWYRENPPCRGHVCTLFYFTYIRARDGTTIIMITPSHSWEKRGFRGARVSEIIDLVSGKLGLSDRIPVLPITKRGGLTHWTPHFSHDSRLTHFQTAGIFSRYSNSKEK